MITWLGLDSLLWYGLSYEQRVKISVYTSSLCSTHIIDCTYKFKGNILIHMCIVSVWVHLCIYLDRIDIRIYTGISIYICIYRSITIISTRILKS